ncbi:MAG: hypothetical protein H6722_25745 [Sandaracinus sp.]|nr:hypothetical protein [Sandaracinus sp.]
MTRVGRTVLALGALCVACGDDDVVFDASVLEDATIDGATDGGSDAGLDAGPPTCVSQLAEGAFELAPGFRRTQIHPAATFDGERLFVTLTVVEEEGSGFDVVWFTVNCDGTVSAPIAVDDDVAPSDLESTIAVRGDTVLVAWQRDVGDGTITTWHRAFDRAGSPTSEPTRLQTMREGAPVEGTHWFPHLAVTDEGFVLHGARGLETVFQVYGQAFDAEGRPSGESFAPAEDLERSQTAPFALADGTVAFDASTETDDFVNVVESETVTVLGESFGASATPTLARVGASTLVAYSAGGRVMLETLGGARVEVGSGGAAWLAEGAVLWLEDFTGAFASRVRARAVGEDLTLGEPVEVPIASRVAGLYRPALHHVEDGWYFALWNDGTSPEFVARGAFLRLR